MSLQSQQSNHVIRVRGARVHNLQNVDVDIPRDALVVFTGVSGSGKSSLAFDTLFAEGQRRYLESLSTYTRQYLEQLERPDADLIEGLPPTISIDQRTGSVQPRSTLGTTTEIYDYLRLLFARAGQAHCTRCERPVTRQSPQAIVDQILSLGERRKVMILAPLVQGRKGTHARIFEQICRDGFVRARVDGEVVDAAEPPKLAKSRVHTIEVVVDRIVVKAGIRQRLQESIELALKHGQGTCLVSRERQSRWDDVLFSEKFACADCGLSFPDLETRSFSFNSPYGACPRCDGLGVVIDADPDETSAAGEWRAAKGGRSTANRQSLIANREPPLASRTAKGGRHETCSACRGQRLNPFARSVTFDGKAIHEVTAMTVAEAAAYFSELASSIDSTAPEGSFSSEALSVARRVLPEIAARLQFLSKVGLEYLTLDRPTRTLSGGEFQRARLGSCLGSKLIGVCYILDEPTIGLHPRDTRRLLETLSELRDQGNSVLVVEHDLDTILKADWVIDLGPGPGSDGGRLVAVGRADEIARDPRSVTGRYLGLTPSPASFRTTRAIDANRQLVLKGARKHNLKNLTVRFPLDVFTCVTGVSGSGKSSLIMQTLIPAIQNAKLDPPPQTRDFDELTGAELIDRVVEIDRSPIGRSGRSNPATYSGMWDEIRKVFAQTRAARIRGYKPRRFSFNSRAGRCETCKGQGTQRIAMHFMPDMFVTCPNCKGSRFNRQTLAVRFAGKNVADVLDMRIDEAAAFFNHFPKLRSILETFADVGLGYLCLGQSSLSLSGGEAQRVKLATQLSRGGREPAEWRAAESRGPTAFQAAPAAAESAANTTEYVDDRLRGKPPARRTLFVLDEPTTGLHPEDVAKLVSLLHRLVEQGDSVIVIEHQLDVIRCADWLIDLGPEGGAAGGEIVVEGVPDEVADAHGGPTQHALQAYLAARSCGSS